MSKKGNKNAEKWTEKKAIAFVNDVHSYNLSNKKNYHLGLSIIESGGYPHLWSYLAEKFEENKAVFSAIKKAESFLEARIVNSTISGEAKSAAMAIFYLKNKHSYKDKTETELTGKDGKDLIPETDLSKLTPKERKEYIKLQAKSLSK